MKKSTLVIVVMISGLLMASQIVTSCGSKSEQTKEEGQTSIDSTDQDQMKGDTTALVYACPMHPDVTGKEGDTCPKCNMKLEPVKDADTTKHEH